MIYRRIWLWLHTCKVIHTAVALIKAISLPIKGHGEQLSYPFFIYSTYSIIISKFTRIAMHMNIHSRHPAEMFSVYITQPLIIVAYTTPHVTIAFLWYTILITYIIHKVMIIAALQIRCQHCITQWVNLANVVIIAVKNVDVFHTIPVCAQLPKGRFFQLLQL